MAKSAIEKLNDQRPAKVVNTPKGTLLIPTPLEVNELMSQVTESKLTTITIIREKLAKRYNAESTCPLCAGIFASIAAKAAEETKIPWWRTLKDKGFLNPKYPLNQKELLEKEGHIIIQKGKNFKVENYEEKLS